MKGECWIWTGWKKPEGYGKKWVKGKSVSAHRWYYEQYVGPIPEGMEIDHLCRNRACVYPLHLEAVTQVVNNSRRVYKITTHCKWGHEYTPENTYTHPQKGYKVCRECKRNQVGTRGACAS